MAALWECSSAGNLAKELEDKTFAMKAGDVTDVIRTKQGYVILKVVDHQMAGIPPMKDILPKIQDALYYQKLQPALRAYLTKLREDAYIDIKPGTSIPAPVRTRPSRSKPRPPKKPTLRSWGRRKRRSWASCEAVGALMAGIIRSLLLYTQTHNP